MATLVIKQTKSPIGGTLGQRETLRTLGLRKIGQSVEKTDKPEVLGMIRKVAHLVSVERKD